MSSLVIMNIDIDDSYDDDDDDDRIPWNDYANYREAREKGLLDSALEPILDQMDLVAARLDKAALERQQKYWNEYLWPQHLECLNRLREVSDLIERIVNKNEKGDINEPRNGES